MSTTARTSLREAINAKCRGCIFDPDARGKWREQVAACTSGNCELFDVRPVPRDCVHNGVLIPAQIAAVRAKLDGHSIERNTRG